jgi:hypothetical protein
LLRGTLRSVSARFPRTDWHSIARHGHFPAGGQHPSRRWTYANPEHQGVHNADHGGIDWSVRWPERIAVAVDYLEVIEVPLTRGAERSHRHARQTDTGALLIDSRAGLEGGDDFIKRFGDGTEFRCGGVELRLHPRLGGTQTLNALSYSGFAELVLQPRQHRLMRFGWIGRSDRSLAFARSAVARSAAAVAAASVSLMSSMRASLPLLPFVSAIEMRLSGVGVFVGVSGS